MHALIIGGIRRPVNDLGWLLGLLLRFLNQRREPIWLLHSARWID